MALFQKKHCLWAFLAFFMLCSHLLLGQNIKRKPSLGAAFLKEDKGLTINKVFPNTTAQSLGLKEGDRLLSINGLVFNETKDIVAYIPTLAVGTDFTVQVIRLDKKMTLKGKLLAKPTEISPTGEVFYDEVAFRGGYLRSYIHKPKGDGQFPVVYYIQGYPCQTVEMPNNDAIRQAVDGWVEQGYVVYRVEKPGLGESINTPPCETIDFNTEIDAFEAGLRAIETYKFVNKDQIFLFGHSLGGLVAPVLAARNKVCGVMVYGTLAVSWYEYLLDLHRYQSEFFGEDYVEIDKNVRQMNPFLYDWLVARTPLPKMKENKAYDFVFSNPNNSAGYDSNNDMVIGRSFDFFPSVNAISYYEAWRNTEEPVLAIYGEHDIQALGPQGAETIARIVNHYRPGNATFLLMQDTEHLFLNVPDMATNAKMVADQSIFGTYFYQNFNSQITMQTVSWMKAQMSKK